MTMDVRLIEYTPGKWRVDRSEIPVARSDLPLPYVISDTMPPTEQVDGKFYTSKAAFRAVGRALGLTEVGKRETAAGNNDRRQHTSSASCAGAWSRTRSRKFGQVIMNDTTTQTADAGSPPPSVPTEVTIPEQSPEPQHGSTGVQAPDKSGRADRA
jgi:hypothetical protein